MFQLNALWMLEREPCTNCLQITDKRVIDANRLDLTVQLRHPFPLHPEYTGFDVYGGLMFPATAYLEDPDFTMGNTWSVAWRYNGGAQMLNADGYDNGFALCPWWWNPDEPKWKFFIDGVLGGEIVQEKGVHLQWPFRMFRTTETRNMFEVGRTCTRTYELWLPEDETIRFGYVVEAHWEPPDTTPVTDPASNFPRSANRYGPYWIEVVDVSGPVSSTQDAEVRVKVHYFPGEFDSGTRFFGNSGGDFHWGNGGPRIKRVEQISSEEGLDEYVVTVTRWHPPYQGPPGIYPLFLIFKHGCLIEDPWNCALGYQVVEIEVLD